MRSPHVGIILTLVLVTISYDKPVNVDSDGPVKILGMHVTISETV
jgi:hypothetical protein